MSQVVRCAVCRAHAASTSLTRTDLPGGWRCSDHAACRARVRAIVAAHQGLAEVCQ